MLDPSQVLREKIQQYKQVLKEIEALRMVIPMLAEPPAKEPTPNEPQH